MSLTRTEPAAVPSLFHSSVPCPAPSAAKKTVPASAEKLRGLEEAPGVGSRSARSSVPAAVPSLVQSSEPFVPSSAAKKILPPDTAKGRAPG